MSIDTSRDIPQAGTRSEWVSLLKVLEHLASISPVMILPGSSHALVLLPSIVLRFSKLLHSLVHFRGFHHFYVVFFFKLSHNSSML